MLKHYERAKTMQPENALALTANAAVVPVFMDNKVAYRREWIEDGQKKWGFFCVDAESGRESCLFDREELAALLGRAAGEACQADRLDLRLLQAEDGCLSFEYKEKTYRYGGGQLMEEKNQDCSVSPNGKYAVYLREHNLWLRETVSGKETQLTFDGILHWDYASRFEGDTSFVTDKRAGQTPKPRILWAPDGERFVTYKMDQRAVKDLHLVQAAPPGEVSRPVLHTYKFCMPGDDETATASVHVFDVRSKTMIRADLPDMPVTFMTPIHELLNSICWSDKGSFVLCYSIERGYKKAVVYRISPETGSTQKLLEESTDTFLFFDFFHLLRNENTECTGNSRAPMWCSEEENTLLWLSNRDGWHQIYAYDLRTGEQKGQVTRGKFEVCQLHFIDWESRRLYFSAMGLQSDPYDCSLCVCSLDGGEMRVLSEGEGNHLISFAPWGGCYTDLLTESDLPPEFSLHKRDGSQIAVLARCDAQLLEKNGFLKPIRFKLPGADGKTEIFGILLMPAGAQGKIPVVDYYYGGTQVFNTPHTFLSVVTNGGLVESIAQLGIACVILDGVGTPGRGKKYHDACYQRLKDCAGLEDHAAALRQLCDLYPVLDADRIGVWGHSGGGYAAFRCMTEHGELYKCGISSGGNHVQEIYLQDWSERFMGMFDRELWKEQSAEPLAERLEGPLLLMHGELDDNVHPANTIRMVNALIRANKDFEMLIFPNYAHALRPSRYFRRKILDFFTVRLLGQNPPKEYCL